MSLKHIIRKYKKDIIPFIICLSLAISIVCLLIPEGSEKEKQIESSDENAVAVVNEPKVLITETPIITETPMPQPDWYLELLNKDHYMKEGYVPELAEVEDGFLFDTRAVHALQQMLAEGRAAGMDLRICSAYRDLDKQRELYEEQVQQCMYNGLSYEDACTEAITVVAYPRTSEHNIGLAVDIVAGHYQRLDERQAETEESQWLKENCWKYGFILRYPIDKTEITGIIFEPWHYRYVGVEAAKEIMERGICLEEYMEEKYGIK